jgi:hypothetical protein
MKKKVYTIFLIFSSFELLFGQAGTFSGRSRFGLQVLGSHEVTINNLSGTEDVETGFSFGADFLCAVHDNIELGIGIEYQIPRSQVKYEGDFNFAPLYGIIRFPISLRYVTLYSLGRIGYGFFFGEERYTGTFGKLTGGFYYAVGGGIELIRFTLFGRENYLFLESTYSANNGRVEDDYFNYSADVCYRRMDIFFGLGGKF